MPQMTAEQRFFFIRNYRLEKLCLEISDQLVPRIDDLRHALAIICHDIKANELRFKSTICSIDRKLSHVLSYSCDREVYLRLLLATEYCLANGWREFVYEFGIHFNHISNGLSLL